MMRCLPTGIKFCTGGDASNLQTLALRTSEGSTMNLNCRSRVHVVTILGSSASLFLSPYTSLSLQQLPFLYEDSSYKIPESLGIEFWIHRRDRGGISLEGFICMLYLLGDVVIL